MNKYYTLNIAIQDRTILLRIYFTTLGSTTPHYSPHRLSRSHPRPRLSPRTFMKCFRLPSNRIASRPTPPGITWRSVGLWGGEGSGHSPLIPPPPPSLLLRPPPCLGLRACTVRVFMCVRRSVLYVCIEPERYDAGTWCRQGRLRSVMA